MKKAVFALTAVLLFGCAQTTTETPPYVGTWVGVLSPENPGLQNFTPEMLQMIFPEEIHVEMQIRANSEYDLLVTYPESNRTAFTNTGTWTMQKDTLYLTGTSCAIIDTSTNTMVDRECPVMTIPVNITDNVFDVSFKTLTPLAPVMGINLPPMFLDMLSSITIAFIKKDESAQP